MTHDNVCTLIRIGIHFLLVIISENHNMLDSQSYI